MELEELQRAIEAILFAAGERMDIQRLAAVLETDPSDIEKAADALADQYAFERRGIRILKLEKGYQMVSAGDFDHYRLLPAGHQGHGRADPGRRQRLLRGGSFK